MSEVAFKLENINKTIGKRHILHDISFEAYAGEVFGFLGPNGAGKTTTIKAALGLISADSGKIEIAGIDTSKDFAAAMAQVGAIVENPELYKYLTGRENLKMAARVHPSVTPQRVDEVVEQVKLTNRIDEKISKYSLGMRQRLGVAAAILHKPKVLILDEPTNGLDPAGIKELRDILKRVAHEEECCVIVSSHLMSEMELMCDRVGIIANGEMIGVYTLDEITRNASGGGVSYLFEVSDLAKAAKLTEGNIVNEMLEVQVSGENPKEQAAEIAEALMKNGIRTYSMKQKEHRSLEDVFIQLTEQNEGDGQIG